ncbi:MAG TPA: aminotransferase class I/II-fold pyridoxal phosphate-dependent enzyme [Terriglobales bacterium]|nr:aminotransferase class I/II-fold pyridoxal phosphate-dependent enzyme [Terriglobales bacterium]
MTWSRTTSHSPYMEFAKLHSDAKYNLATSGVKSYPLAELPVRLEDLEINGPTIYGYAPLQERLAKKNGVNPDCVVAATGTSMANHLAMAATIEPGDEVLVEQPTYELLLSTLHYLGAQVRRFPRNFENNFEIEPEQVAKQITSRTRLIVITNFHNPSSAMTSPSTLADIGDLTRSVGARVLVDEVYLEALFDQPFTPAFHLGKHFLVTSSLTKAYGLSGVRCGWVLAEPSLATRMWRINDLYGATPAHPAELISVIALDNLDKIAARAEEIVESNRRALNSFLDSRADLECVRPAHGTSVFPRLLRGSADDFCDFLRRNYETSVVPGRFFEMPQHFRIGIGGDPEMTITALERLSQALDDYSGR